YPVWRGGTIILTYGIALRTGHRLPPCSSSNRHWRHTVAYSTRFYPCFSTPRGAVEDLQRPRECTIICLRHRNLRSACGMTGGRMTPYLWLFPVGVLIGAFGTLIGAGGGFVLTPILLLVYPHESPDIITSISLAVVFFNAFSGSAAYARMRRIDYRSGVLFALATIPGAVIGALTTTYMPRRAFDLVFGLCMLLAALFLLLRRERPLQPATQDASPHRVVRSVIEADGTPHTFSYNLRLG